MIPINGCPNRLCEPNRPDLQPLDPLDPQGCPWMDGSALNLAEAWTELSYGDYLNTLFYDIY